MSIAISNQEAVVINLIGQLKARDSSGNTRELNIGDLITQGEQLLYGADVHFQLEYADGSRTTEQDLTQEAPHTDATQASDTQDADIAALQAQLINGADPSTALPETAAGAPGNQGDFDYAAIARTGDETLANAGYDTLGFTQPQVTTQSQAQIAESPLSSLSSNIMNFNEANLPAGSAPQSSALTQQQSLPINAPAGIASLSINGVLVISNGEFAGQVNINTAYGLLSITGFDPVSGLLTYSFTLTSAASHTEGDPLSEIFTLQLIDAQGRPADSTITVNLADDSPRGLDDVNSIAEDTSQSISGNVLDNDTPGADSGQVSQVSNAAGQSSAVDAAVSIQGAYGVLTLAADGSYTYQLDNSNAAVQALAEGQQLLETFAYLLTDGDGDSVAQELSITVTGSNDAPVITTVPGAGADAGTVVEAGNEDDGTLVPGTPEVSGILTASDADNGAILTWSTNASSQYGSFSIDANSGQWTYHLDNALVDSLAEGQTLEEQLLVTVTDEHGASASQLVTITILGTNDSPIITSGDQDASGALAEPMTDEPAQVGGILTATDVDNNAVLSWSGNASGVYGEFSIDSATGAWRYSLNDSALVDSLALGETHEEQFLVTVTDEFGATDTQWVTVTITGSNDAPVITSGDQDASGTVVEAGVQPGGNLPEPGVLQIGDTLSASDVDNGAVLNWSGNASGVYGEFVIDAATGAWRYSLNDNALVDSLALGETHEEQFLVTVTDEHGASASQWVTVTVTGTNDMPVITSGAQDASGALVEPMADEPAQVGGILTATDVDNNAELSWSGNASGVYGEFSIDSATGAWRYSLNDSALVDSLALGETQEEQFLVTVTDEFGATDTQWVTVTITGSNDAPVITSGDQDASGTVIEAGVQPGGNLPEPGVLQIGDTLSASDVDNGAVLNWSGNASGVYGEFVIDAATGAWTYSLNDNPLVDSLALGETHEEQFLVTVTDEHGASATQWVTVTVTGTNDMPVITSGAQDASGALAEPMTDEPAQVGGILTATDVDNGAVLSWSGNASGVYGEFSIDPATGAWRYSLNDSALVDSLALGETHEEQFLVTVTDEHGATDTQWVTVTITGSNDAPVITSGDQDASGTVIEAGVQPENTPYTGITATGGTLTASDVDNGAVLSWSFAPQVNAYGTFAIDASTGAWTYVLDNNAADSLALGQSADETFLVTVTDEHGVTATQEVTVTVIGTNDAPILTVDASGSVIEDIGVVADMISTNGALNFTDVDIGDTHQLSFDYRGDISWSGGVLSQAQIAAIVAGFSIDGDSWDYSVLNSLIGFLSPGETITLSFDVTVTDNNLATDTRVVSISIKGSNDAPIANADTNVVDEGVDGIAAALISGQVIQGEAHGGYADQADTDPEGMPVQLVQVSSSVETIGDGSSPLSTYVIQGEYGVLTIYADGSYSYQLNDDNPDVDRLNEGDTLDDVFTYWIADPVGGTAQSTLSITINGHNDSVQGEFAKEIWMPASVDELVNPYGDGYPMNISAPTDVDDEVFITVTGLPAFGSIGYYEGGVFHALSMNEGLTAEQLGNLVYIPNGDGLQHDVSFTFELVAGVETVNGEFIVHTVPINSLGSQIVNIGDGSSPLNSGNAQDAALVITDDFAAALNTGTALGSLELFTDFQQQPNAVPVPIGERDVGTVAGDARETEVSVTLTINGMVFMVIAADAANAITQTWSYDAASGLMKANIDYSHMFLLDNGVPTTTSLADYLLLNQPNAGDVWTVTYLDNNGGNFQARFVQAVFTHENLPDAAITIVGTDDVNNLIFGSTHDDSLTGANQDDRIFGREGDDSLSGLAGNDELIGGSGNDILSGGSGDDYLDGGPGNDSLSGGTGSDYLIGGTGSDVLDGGVDTARDAFIWEAGSADGSTDTVMNFDPAHDVLDLSDILLNEENNNLDDYLQFDFSGGNTTITIDANGTLAGGDNVTIVLDGIDLSVTYGTTNESQIIANLIADHALIVDPQSLDPYQNDVLPNGVNIP
ncbi:retention module-containing protein [Shewanella sp. AS16]|uniref:retention module-containing protein n=1 Tax=Shewanella sp. AS16 TaxID=2907625 RepID=UPI001F348602|nr:retention module-containing protein [Shewanella sp. AS16]MCE9685976.1 retention module-containing protein [Shewanella sp. AS16]